MNPNATKISGNNKCSSRIGSIVSNTVWVGTDYHINCSNAVVSVVLALKYIVAN